MTPLEVFYQTAQYLSKRPFAFLDKGLQKKILSDLGLATKKLMSILKKKSLEDTLAFKVLKELANSIKSMDEVSFIRSLHSLAEVYQLTPL